MGLVIFGAMALYLIASIAIVSFAARAAKKRGKSPWRWGGGTALVMYLLVFWDHIPTMVMHQYYCEKEAGFWVYKTAEQWKAENPGVGETLRSERVSQLTRAGDMRNYTDTYFLNQRFNLVVKKNGPFLINRWRHEQEVVDPKKSEMLAKYIDFSTGYGELALGGDDWRMVKFWLGSKHCSGGEREQSNFRQFKNNLPGVEK